MNTQSFYLFAALAFVICIALPVSLWVGRKVPTLHDRKRIDLSAYLDREASLEADLVTRRHELAACREHIKRLQKQLAKVDADAEQHEAKIMHIVRSAK